MKKTLLTVGALLTAGIALTACGSPGSGLSGSWGDPDAKERPSLRFTPKDAATGAYGGTDGCNTLGGDYTIDGAHVDLGAMHSTMMFCEGVDTWLSLARNATLEGDKLVFTDQNGHEIGTLKRHR